MRRDQVVRTRQALGCGGPSPPSNCPAELNEGYNFTRFTDHRVTYIDRDAQGCENFISDFIRIHSVADIDFNPLEGCESEGVILISSIANEDNLIIAGDDSGGLNTFLWRYPPLDCE